MKKKTNISTVAQKAGISESTVSRVLNHSPLVALQTAHRVRAVISELGYSPSELARGLRVNETRTIGVIVSNVMNSFFTSVVRGIEDAANDSKYSIMLCNTDEKPEKEIQYIHTLIRKQVDGIILASTGGISSCEELVSSTPVVLVDRNIGQADSSPFDTVLVDNCGGAYEAVTHLLEEGYQHIGIITGSNVTTTGYGRLAGYKKALHRAGRRLDEHLIKIGDFLGTSSYRLARELLTQTDCDAIFTANNIILTATLRAADDLHRRIPEELGLISFDNVEWMQYSRLRISAIIQPTYEIGQTAMHLLLDRIAGSTEKPRQIVLDVKLAARESSRRNKCIEREESDFGLHR